MLSQFFLRAALIGAEWVLYLLVLISIFSVFIIVERILYFRNANKGIDEFRKAIRDAAGSGDWKSFTAAVDKRHTYDFEGAFTHALKPHVSGTVPSTEVLEGVAQDALIRTKTQWDKNLTYLATIGSNAPFVGLFGTVLGIIQAFHEIAQKEGIGGGIGAQKISSGLADALVATAVGILVAIPATASFNFFQRKVRSALNESEALKNFVIAKLSLRKG